MGFITKVIRTGLAIGAGITAYQATQKAKKRTGSVDADSFIRSFKEQAIENTKLVVDTVKQQLGEKNGEYRVSDEGENGYTYVDAEPKEDKVSEVFDTVREKAPEVIDKVQDFVEDLRENAPEYKAKAQEFAGDVIEAAKKVIDKNDKDKNDKDN